MSRARSDSSALKKPAFIDLLHKKKIVPSYEEIVGMWYMTSINRKDKQHERVVVLTEHQLYKIKWKNRLARIHYKKFKKIGLLDVTKVEIGNIFPEQESEMEKYGVKLSTQGSFRFFKSARESFNDPPQKEIMEDFVTKLVASRTALSKEPMIPNLLPDTHLSGYFALKDSFSDIDFAHKSQIVSDELLIKLGNSIPAVERMQKWGIIYSTYKHGVSLRTFYANFKNAPTDPLQPDHLPSLMFVMDIKKQIFGGYVTRRWDISDCTYGTAESFLFKVTDKEKSEFKVFKATFDNNEFQLGFKDSIAIGCSSDGFGLWMDSDFLHGNSRTCDTFKNEVLSYDIDFEIIGVEVWAPIFQPKVRPRSNTRPQ